MMPMLYFEFFEYSDWLQHARSVHRVYESSNNVNLSKQLEAEAHCYCFINSFDVQIMGESARENSHFTRLFPPPNDEAGLRYVHVHAQVYIHVYKSTLQKGFQATFQRNI